MIDRVFHCPKCKSLCLSEDWIEKKQKCKACTQNKYHAQRVVIDGETFDSQYELSIWHELLLLQRQGLIRNLERQVTYRLEVNGHLICKYIADFRYICMTDEEIKVLDAKGAKTPLYRLKKKLMKAIYGIEIIEK